MEHESLHELTKELRAILPTKPIQDMLDLYMAFAEMNTKEESGIKADWLDNVASFYFPAGPKRASHKALLNPEGFLKKVLHVVDPKAYDECASNPQKALFNTMDKLGLTSLFKKDDIAHYNPEKDQLTKEEASRLTPEALDKEIETRALRKNIAWAYHRRNSDSHTSNDWTISEMMANINAVMVTTVYAVWLHRNVIRQQVSATTSNNEYGIDKLLHSHVREYDQKIGQGFRYVSLLWESTDNKQSKQMQLDNLLDDKQILLSGDAGCGKTTALDQLEYQAAKKYLAGETSVIPVNLALIGENPAISLTEMICHKLNIPSEYCKTLLQQKNLLLLIDGLNELTTDSEQKKQFIATLEQFINHYPEIRMIVTDRPHSHFTPRIKKIYHLKPLEKEDILKYAKSRPECTDRVLELLSQLLDKPSFTNQVYTPLLINQLLLALSTHEELPEDHSDLIGIYLEALQDREFNEKRDPIAEPGKLDLFLMKLANTIGPEDSIQLLPAYKLCTDVMKEYGLDVPPNSCVNLAVQLGILTQTGQSISFMLSDYHTYYLIRSVDSDI